MMIQEKKMAPESGQKVVRMMSTTSSSDRVWGPQKPGKGQWATSRGQSSVISQGSEVGESLQWKVNSMDLLLGEG